MKHLVLLMACLLTVPPTIHAMPSLEDLQGAWWSDGDSPTAAFAIRGEEVWVDITSTFHPCRIEGDTLIFELGEFGTVRNRIVSLEGDKLTLERPETGQRRVLHRNWEP